MKHGHITEEFNFKSNKKNSEWEMIKQLRMNYENIAVGLHYQISTSVRREKILSQGYKSFAQLYRHVMTKFSALLQRKNWQKFICRTPY